MPKSPEINLGVVGLGDVAIRSYLPELAQSTAGLRLAAVCHRRAEHSAEVARRFGAGASYADYAAMLAKPSIDAIVILTEIDTHYELARAALEAGKHVYVEKTATRTLAEMDELIRLTSERGLVLACAPTLTLSPFGERLREIVRSGELGRLCFARAMATSGGPTASVVHTTDPSRGYGPSGGPLRGLGVYPLQLLIDLFGKARSVMSLQTITIPERVMKAGPAAGKLIPMGTADNTHLLLEFADNILATLTATVCNKAPLSPGIEIVGQDGSLAAHLNFARPRIELSIGAESDRRDAGPIAGWSLARGVERFVEAVRAGNPMNELVDQTRHGIEIIEAAFRSAKEGRKIPLD